MWFQVKQRKPDNMKKNIGSNEACKEVSYSRTYAKELLLARSCWGDRSLEHLSICCLMIDDVGSELCCRPLWNTNGITVNTLHPVTLHKAYVESSLYVTKYRNIMTLNTLCSLIRKFLIISFIVF